MMKWGRRRKQGGPSSSSSSISRAFPLSWLSKFKQNCGGFEPRKAKREVGKKGDSEMGGLPIPRGYCREGRFYSRDEDDDDAFWRISFGEDRVGGSEKGGDCRNSVLRDSSEDEMEPELPGLSMNRSRVEARNFSKAVLSVRKMKGLSEKIEPSEFYKNREGEREEEEEEEEEEAPKERSPGAAEENLVELQKQTDETQVEGTKLEEGDKVEFELKRRRTFSSLKRGSTLRTVEESNLAAEEEMSSDWQNLKNMKIEEIKSRSEKREKSLPQRRRTKQSSRVGVYSPRTAAASRTESCKIKALEDMKRAKLKMKKKAKEGAVQKQRSELESFAIVKCSFDPQVDFRDSMVEMITEKRITRPRELEELLACYLTLNSDEYHDLIIKVFRQVWFDLNQQDGHLFP